MPEARPIPSFCVLFCLTASLALAAVPAWGGLPGATPDPVNVLQDCWTTSLAKDPDPELELYEFRTDEDIDLIWKYKLLVPCSSYALKVVVWDCVDGKPKTSASPVAHVIPFASFGMVPLIPGVPEPLFTFPIFAGTLPPGRYDWGIVVECDDTNSMIRTDGDPDDICGGNLGKLPVFDGPVIFGPEPTRVLDPDPGGSPPGRGPGEDGSTRPWCFEVIPAGM